MSSNRDALDPSGPSQPTPNQAYTTAGNPADHEPAEARSAQQSSNLAKNAPATDHRKAGDEQGAEATATSRGRGVHGAGPGEEKYGKSEEDVGRHKELDGEQMAAPGEGKVSEAVRGNREGKGGAGEQVDFASDLDRKKAEQAPARQAMKEQREHNVDVGGALGQTGGPANSVGKGSYPNSGD